MRRDNENARGGRAVRVERSDNPASGANILLPEEVTASVYDVASEEPRQFVENAVQRSLSLSNGEDVVTVGQMRHDSMTGLITLSKPATEQARQAAESRGVSTEEFVRGVVKGAVEQARQQAQQAAQPAVAQRGYLPLPDPAGVLEAATDGAVRDPLRLAFMQGQQGR